MSLKQDYAEFKEIVKFFARDARSPLRKWWKPFTCVSTFLAGSAAAALSAPFVLMGLVHPFFFFFCATVATGASIVIVLKSTFDYRKTLRNKPFHPGFSAAGDAARQNRNLGAKREYNKKTGKGVGKDISHFTDVPPLPPFRM